MELARISRPAAWGATVALALLAGCVPALDDESTTPPEPEASTALAFDPVTQDPATIDEEYPPAMRELSFISGGSKLNGLVYLADGAGSHPTVAILHGYAGNERNLDLAQALRRAGYNVLYFNYRGSWGSGGEFSASNAIEDVAAALEMLHERAAEYRVDPERIALVGHSFGGFTATQATLADPDVRCLTFIAGANLGALARAAVSDPDVREAFRQGVGTDMDYEGGPIKAEPEAMVADIVDNADRFDLTTRVPELLGRPLLMIAGARDLTTEKAVHHDPFLEALRRAGHERLTERVFDDDHYFGAHRIALARAVVEWLDTSCFGG